MRRIWIDVEDLFQHATNVPRLTGIQRLSFELQQALAERFGTDGPVRFVRHDPRGPVFSEIAWDDVAALYRDMVAVAPAPRAAPLPPVADRPRHGWLRHALDPAIVRLPLPVREQLSRALGFQQAFVRTLAGTARLQAASWGCLAGAVQVALRPPPGPDESAAAEATKARAAAEAAEASAAPMCPGDVLLALGSPWWRSDYASLIVRTRARHGVRFALLIYDIIPVRRPEWFDGQSITSFKSWLDSMLPLADALLAISRFTAHDLERYAAQHGVALRGPINPIPIGSGFGAPPAEALPSSTLPAPGTYVLFVSTIEPRKNHALLFRVWRRLLAEMPSAEVPTLVFAGRRGWLVADLLAQLDNTSWLDGHVVLVEDPSDEDLTALYRGCLFTVFPSLYEGWGLPVTESLAFGKPCVVAAVTSLPEAGGDLARYFDPDDLHDAVGVIRAVLEDRPGLAAWEARVRREFRPVPWSASAEAVLRALEVVSTPVVAET